MLINSFRSKFNCCIFFCSSAVTDGKWNEIRRSSYASFAVQKSLWLKCHGVLPVGLVVMNLPQVRNDESASRNDKSAQFRFFGIASHNSKRRHRSTASNFYPCARARGRTTSLRPFPVAMGKGLGGWGKPVSPRPRTGEGSGVRATYFLNLPPFAMMSGKICCICSRSFASISTNHRRDP